jgi:hypothetical protein
MKIEFTDGTENVILDTQILWWVKMDTPASFDDILTGTLENLKARGFRVVESLDNYEGWEYIWANLAKGEDILSK